MVSDQWVEYIPIYNKRMVSGQCTVARIQPLYTYIKWIGIIPFKMIVIVSGQWRRSYILTQCIGYRQWSMKRLIPYIIIVGSGGQWLEYTPYIDTLQGWAVVTVWNTSHIYIYIYIKRMGCGQWLEYIPYIQ